MITRMHIQCDQQLRRAYLQTGVPVHLTGIGGPRAPHVFEFDRRCNLGDSVAWVKSFPYFVYSHC